MKKTMTRSLFVLLISLLSLTANAADYAEGVQYAAIEPAVPTNVAPGKVEVVEMFWYGCPHCYDFEPYLNEWLKHKPANVEFIRIPAIFGSSLWRLHATAFYAAEALGVLDKTHDALFDAIHKEKRQLNTEDALADFYAEHGVDKKAFHDAFNSFLVQAKVRRAADLTQRYGLSGVPSMVVAGKYRTDGPMAQSYEGLLNVVNYLVQRESHPTQAAAK